MPAIVGDKSSAAISHAEGNFLGFILGSPKSLLLLLTPEVLRPANLSLSIPVPGRASRKKDRPNWSNRRSRKMESIRIRRGFLQAQQGLNASCYYPKGRLLSLAGDRSDRTPEAASENGFGYASVNLTKFVQVIWMIELK
jgi:hypothetical protein